MISIGEIGRADDGRVIREDERNKRPPCGGLSGGPSRDRTDDLRHAMAALSQLSYGPQAGLRDCSAELVIACLPDSGMLVVTRRGNPEVELDRSVDYLPGNEVAALELRTECCEGIELTAFMIAASAIAPF